MDFLYIKALHIIFIVTWFAGMFYIVRLFIYHTEAQEKTEPEKQILSQQFNIMIRRLWMGITWPSAVLTLIFGPLTMYRAGYFNYVPTWLWIKLIFVLLLYVYHFTLHTLFRQQMKGIFRYSSQQLRVWNEAATVLLVAIVMLVVVKTGLSVAWGLGGLVAFVIVLMGAIRVYKKLRTGK